MPKRSYFRDILSVFGSNLAVTISNLLIGIILSRVLGAAGVGLYSSMYVTMNARALMNFLSLRTAREGSHFPSYPQREIEMVAEKMEEHFARLMPLTYGAFEKSGRIAP